MELTMTNNFGFCELNENEMMMIDGGNWGAIVVGVAGLVAVGAVIACTAINAPAGVGLAVSVSKLYATLAITSSTVSVTTICWGVCM